MVRLRIAWWRDKVNTGNIYKQIEAEELVIKAILKCDNIKLYSFNNLTNITTDLNNYKDAAHYLEWINSLMLRYMKDEKCLLTLENYQDYLKEELAFYTTYDYFELNYQTDYKNDQYAEAILNYEINGVEPLELLEVYQDRVQISNASLIPGQYDGKLGIRCNGVLQRTSESNISIADYIASAEYVGAKIRVDDISAYKYLVFYGIKNKNHGQPGVYIYDQNNLVLTEFSLNYNDVDNQWHQYMIDVSELSGPVTILLNGGYIDNTGSEDSIYTFSDITLY